MSMLMKAKELLPCGFLSWHKASQKYGVHSFLPLASIQHTKKKTKKQKISDKMVSTATQGLQWHSAHLWHWIRHFLWQILQQLLSNDVGTEVFRSLVCQDLTVVLPWTWFGCSQEVALQRQYMYSNYDIKSEAIKQKHKTEVKIR